MKSKHKLTDEQKEEDRCLTHYPGEYYMEEAQKMAPAIFGEWND